MLPGETLTMTSSAHNSPSASALIKNVPDLQFRDVLNGLIERFEEEQQASLLQASRLMADACEHDRLIYLFGGGGHTCLVMHELFWRAGGLANICPMLDFAIHPATPAYLYLGHERMHGVGNHIVSYYGVGQGDIVLMFHSYGFNAPTIDAALECKRRGATVIGISSSDWHRKIPEDFPIRHDIRKTLFDIADVRLDDYVPYGDTVIEVEGFDQPITGISSTIDFYIAHRLEIECVKECVRRNVVPPIWRSANIPGGDEFNAMLRAKYNGRVKLL
jgi:uncharacterized phosphosugar-binding protein